MIADTAKLIVDLSLSGNFAKDLKTSQKALGTFSAKLDQTATRGFRAGQQIGTGIKSGLKIAAVGVGLLFSQVALGLNSLVKLESATKQTAAVIKSTGAVAGISTDTVRNLAEKYESLNATIGDELIQSGQNVLLTFTNIRTKAFEPALKAALDLNTALNRGPDGLQGSIVAVGKALNDPSKGLTALQRLGIVFTKTQKEQIQAALDVNDTYKAQQIILAELDRRYSGSFIAGGQTTAGKVAKFTDSIEDLQRALATALLPTVGIVADRLSTFLTDPKVVAGISDLGTKIAGLFSEQNIDTGATILGDLFKIAKDVAPALQAAAEVTGRVVATAVGLFRSLPPELQTLLVTGLAINKLTGGLVTNLAGGLISAVISSFKGLMNVNAAAVTVNGPIVGGGSDVVPGPGGGIKSAAKEAFDLFKFLAIPIGAGVTAGTIAANNQASIFNQPGADPQTINNAVKNGTMTFNGRVFQQIPQAIRQAAAKDDRNSLRLEQAIKRKEQKVSVSVSTKTILNGRLIEANLGRYSTVFSSSGNLGGVGPR